MQTNRKKSGVGPKPAKKAIAGKDSFEAVAKRLECDEDPAHFEAALKKIARHKPSDPKTKTKADTKKPGQ